MDMETEDIYGPGKYPYTAPDGTQLVLCLGMFGGFKAYWTESPSGKLIGFHKFYRPGIVEEITGKS